MTRISNVGTQIDLTMRQGADFLMSLTFTNADGSPFESSITANGGTGGAGAQGGGGGGGGSALTGKTSGAGGAGGAGLVIVVTFF